MIFSLIVVILSLPLWLFLKRLPPHPVINAIRMVFWEIMKWIFPIGLTIAILLYLIYKILQPIILGLSLNIVDIRYVTPFKELWDTGIFDWVEGLLTLNPVKMYHASWKVLKNTPAFAYELFGGQIRKAESSAQELESIAQEEIAIQKAKTDAYNACVESGFIEINPNMSAVEKLQATTENQNIKNECRKQHLD
jgi:hypothetical protein